MSDLVGNHIVGFPTRRLICHPDRNVSELLFDRGNKLKLALCHLADHQRSTNLCNVHGKQLVYVETMIKLH